jgi:Tol biopolymer transport system component
MTAVALLVVTGVVLGTGRVQPPTPNLRWNPLTKAVKVRTFTTLASDGRNVYFTEYDENGCRPMRLSLEGGDPQPVRMPFPDAFVADVTADGHLLINVRENCKNVEIQGLLWEIDVNTGAVRRVGDLVAQAGAYSPDATRIAFARGNQLWLVNRDGSAPSKIAELPGLINVLHWSPDGKRLRLSVQAIHENRFVLWEAEPGGKPPRPLLPEWKNDSELLGGVWSTSANGFVFEATRHGSTDLWRMEEGGWLGSRSKVEQLTAGPLDFGAPAAIPGRNELVVLGTRRQGSLERFDSAIRSFVPFLNGISAQMVDFSRDGKWVAYVTYPDAELWRARADGTEPLQLTHAPMRAGLPRISPDGRQIAFSGGGSGEGLRTYLISINGGAPWPATIARGAVTEVAPTWSADGSRLLFRYDRPGGETVLQHNVLQIVDLNSHAVSTVRDSYRKFNQRWSPDGKWIVATTNDEAELVLYDVAREQWTVLAKMRADYPSWSADSRFVYFVTVAESGSAVIDRVSIATRSPELVASLAESDRAIDDVWGQWAGVMPDGTPLILRSADLQQLYLLSFATR